MTSFFKKTIYTVFVYLSLALIPLKLVAKAPTLDLSEIDISQVSEINPQNSNPEYTIPPERFPSMTVALVDDIIDARTRLDAMTNPNDSIAVPLPDRNEFVVAVVDPSSNRNEILTAQDGDEMFGRELSIIRRERQELAINKVVPNQETLIASNSLNLLSQSNRPGYENCVVRFYYSERELYRYEDQCEVDLIVLNETTQETYRKRFSINRFCIYMMQAIKQDNLATTAW